MLCYNKKAVEHNTRIKFCINRVVYVVINNKNLEYPKIPLRKPTWVNVDKLPLDLTDSKNNNNT